MSTTSNRTKQVMSSINNNKREVLTDRRRNIQKEKEDLYTKLFKTQRDNDPNTNNHNDLFLLKLSEIELQNKLKHYPQLESDLFILTKSKKDIITQTSSLKSKSALSTQSLLNQLSLLKQTHSDLIDKNNQAEKEHINLNETKANTLRLIDEQSKEVNVLRDKIDELGHIIEQDNKDQYTLIHERNISKQSKLERRMQKKRYIEDNKRLAYECKVKNDILKKSARENEQLNRELEDVNKKVEVLRGQLDEKCNEIFNVTEVNKQIELKMIEIERELKCLGIESESIKDMLVKQQESIAIEETKKHELNTAIFDREKQVNVLKCQLEHEKDYAKIVEDDIEKCKADNERRNGEVKRLEQLNAGLMREMNEIGVYQSQRQIQEENCEGEEEDDNDQRSLGQSPLHMSILQSQREHQQKGLDSNSLHLTDLYSDNRSFLHETIKALATPPEKKNGIYEITVQNLHKAD